MNILPFTIKTANQSVERLCRITARDHQDIDVTVQTLLHTWETPGLHALDSGRRRELNLWIFQEAKGYIYEAFIAFLRADADPEVFPPTNLFNQAHHCRYHLLLSPPRFRELYNIYSPRHRASRHFVTFENHEFLISARPQLSDSEAYLIVPNQFTLFLRQVNEADAIHVYCSDFIDLTSHGRPPLELHPQDVIDAIENALEGEPRPIGHRQPLLMPPTVMPEKTPAKLAKCPVCEGPVQRLGGENYFCLDCEWDNLSELT